jgi:hypothetical protein
MLISKCKLHSYAVILNSFKLHKCGSARSRFEGPFPGVLCACVSAANVQTRHHAFLISISRESVT